MTTEHPTVFIIFGVTGDLARKKLFPALFHLFSNNYLPDQFRIVGVARKEFTTSSFKDYVREALEEKGISDTDAFIETLQFVQGQFDEAETYTRLQSYLTSLETEEFNTCSNKLFYLSVPPSLYSLILHNLSSSGLTVPCSDGEGWTRVLVEKPFGNDLATAQELDKILGSLFREKQIFRIDHYLTKETVQNILTFRFSNSIFEPLWNKEYVDSVEITMLEKSVVGDRGAFYDTTGALRDVGQNHLLQLLALVGMEPLSAMDADEIRAKRADVFKHLQPGECFVRGQYEGYHDEKGVEENSNTETFFSMDMFVETPRWRGVPFRITSGKGVSENKVEIRVRFKDMTPGSFLPERYAEQEMNTLTFSIQPEEGIALSFWAKRPGFAHTIEPRVLSFNYRGENIDRHIDAYEKVIYDCVVGDQTLFASTDEVMASWKFITPIVESWKNTDLTITYPVGADVKTLME